MHAVEGYQITLDALLTAAKDHREKLRELAAHIDELDDDVRAMHEEDRVATRVAANLTKRADTRLRRWSIRAAISGALVGGIGELINIWRGVLG